MYANSKGNLIMVDKMMLTSFEHLSYSFKPAQLPSGNEIMYKGTVLTWLELKNNKQPATVIHLHVLLFFVNCLGT